MKTLSMLAACAALTLTAAAQDLAIQGGKVIPIQGPTIDQGVVLIRGGRILKVGKQGEVEVPWDAKVIDATGKVVMPTWVIAHGEGGLRGGNENMQNVPYVSVADAVDPASTWFEDVLRNGVGTVHVLPGNQTLLGGVGMVLRPCGRTVEDMAVRTRSGIKMSLWSQGGGRLQQVRRLRRAIDDIRDYIADFDRRKAEFDKEKAAGAIAKDKEWTEEYERNRKPGIELIQKKLVGWLYVPSAVELDEALRLAQELDLRVVLGRDIQRGIPQLLRLAAPVVLDETIEFHEKDPDTDVERKVCTAKLLFDAGIPFALSLGNGAQAQPFWQLATCVRNGVDRKVALEALTTVPARMLGLEQELGTLTEGKLGNVQVLTGDPLQATTWVEQVVLEGQLVYERSKDPRLQYLFTDGAGAAKVQKDGEGK